MKPKDGRTQAESQACDKIRMQVSEKVFLATGKNIGADIRHKIWTNVARPVGVQVGHQVFEQISSKIRRQVYVRVEPKPDPPLRKIRYRPFTA
jgi:hypothetical protein